MFKHILRTSSFLASLLLANQALAFCGFYVAKADTDIFNEASKVVIARDDDKTVITMVNDFKGDLDEFAMVVPVPTFLEEGQINVGNSATVDHLDAYTAPRLVEYFDDNPCNIRRYEMMAMRSNAVMEDAGPLMEKDLGVTVDAEYTVGEYDIIILSAKESDGLTVWLNSNGYKIPEGAERVLESYIKQGTRFFVAKVNLQEQAKTGYQFLRPLQIAFESPKFMLPIRLGTVNAKDTQELFVFTLTRKGRVETSNYRTVKIPSDLDVPLYVQDEFSAFYTDMFKTAWQRESGKAVFLEYAWDMNWCDPCAADPLSHEQLKQLGVFWLDDTPSTKPGIMPSPRPMPQSQARDVFVTRLHLRYNGDLFPEDLMFKQTADRSNFQGRYITRHPWDGTEQCEQADRYRAGLPDRFNQEAKNLANITGWSIADIRQKMAQKKQVFEPKPVLKWWQKLWK